LREIVDSGRHDAHESRNLRVQDDLASPGTHPVLEGKVPMPNPPKRLNEAVDDYLLYRRARFAPTTVAQEGYVLRRFAAAVGDIQLRHLRSERVTEWFYGSAGLMQPHTTRDGRLRSAIVPSSHNYYRNRLASFLRYCAQRGWLRDDLLKEVAPMPVRRRERQQPPPRLLLAMLDAAATPRDRAFMATAMNTGLRSNEIIRIRVGHVSLGAGELFVTISKTHEEDRLPITADLDGELRRWIMAYQADLGRPLVETDHLFPARRASRYARSEGASVSTQKARTPSGWNPERPIGHTERILQEAMKSVGLETKGEGTHTIRRAVARAWFDQLATSDLGYDGALRTVSSLLHHKSGTTTEHYLGLSSERQRRDEVLRGQPFLTGMVQPAAVLALRSAARQD
jgi:integrase